MLLVPSLVEFCLKVLEKISFNEIVGEMDRQNNVLFTDLSQSVSFFYACIICTNTHLFIFKVFYMIDVSMVFHFIKNLYSDFFIQ